MIHASKIKDILFDEHEGSEALETVILSPLMFATFFILLYFFFMALTFISYSNVANSIAQELNMRQTGYQTAMQNYTTVPRILTYRVSDNAEIPSSAYLDASQITVSPETQELKSATYFALDKYKKQFLIPFSQITGVKVTTTQPIHVSSGKRLAGTVIKVEIYYKTMSVGQPGRGLIPMTAVGYGIIA